jgi:replicative DNA helicase
MSAVPIPININKESMDARLYNLEAEQSILGAILLNNSLLESLNDFLRHHHFSDVIHQKIYQTLDRMVDRGQLADPITLRDFFSKDVLFEAVGGSDYLIDLANNVMAVSHVHDYARLVHDFYIRRQLVGIGSGMISRAHDQHDTHKNAQDQIEEAERNLYQLAIHGSHNKGFQSLSDSLAAALEIAESARRKTSGIAGVTTGFIDLDKNLGGLHPSDLVILAARPSMGKTALGLNIAYQAASSNNNKGAVAFFSLEMSSDQLAGRILSSEARISSDLIRRGAISQNDFDGLIQASRKMDQTPLMIDDTPALSVSGIRNRARRLQRQSGLSLIVVDYLQLMTAGNGGGSDNRVQEVSEITRSLKALAKELQVPVIALSQLSRAVESRDDKRPQLSDLRESGSIEQDADVVMFIYREEYYESRKKPSDTNSEKYATWQKRIHDIKNKAEIIIAKQRHGPIGTVDMFYDSQYVKFGNWTNQSSSYS